MQDIINKDVTREKKQKQKTGWGSGREWRPLAVKENDKSNGKV